MSVDTTTYTIEIKREQVEGDPALSIFRVKIQRLGMDPAEWLEAFGSAEQLRAFIAGMKTILILEGFAAHQLDWYIQDKWQEPIGMLFTFDGEGGYLIEDLSSDGSVRRV